MMAVFSKRFVKIPGTALVSLLGRLQTLSRPSPHSLPSKGQPALLDLVRYLCPDLS